jgi:hypothetical protein
MKEPVFTHNSSTKRSPTLTVPPLGGPPAWGTSTIKPSPLGGVGLPVGAGVLVQVAVPVRSGVELGGTAVLVRVEVGVRLGTCVNVAVPVGMAVLVRVAVAVGVRVFVTDGVEVGGTGVRLGVLVAAWVKVGVGVPPAP